MAGLAGYKLLSKLQQEIDRDNVTAMVDLNTGSANPFSGEVLFATCVISTHLGSSQTWQGTTQSAPSASVGTSANTG